MKATVAKGYLLEVIITKLIAINGYNIIMEADNQEIVSKQNGLNLRGRGGFHQFDTLGRFKITPPFAYPLRLFVEAKYYSNKVGINVVRMGVGILEDVNTNYSTVEMNAEELSLEKYQYNYAIFSASGFTEDAQRFAIAHKIHLIDLTGEEYSGMLDSINSITELLVMITSNGTKEIDKKEFSIFKKYLINVLMSLNRVSEENGEVDWLVDVSHATSKEAHERLLRNHVFRGLDERRNDSRNIVGRLVEEILKLKSLMQGKYIYLATINSPYIIPLYGTEEFRNLLEKDNHREVAITWLRDNPTRWTITLNDNNEEDISIQFTLPKILHEYMLSGIVEDNAIEIKRRMIGTFAFISYFDDERPTFCTLKFDEYLTEELLR